MKWLTERLICVYLLLKWKIVFWVNLKDIKFVAWIFSIAKNASIFFLKSQPKKDILKFAKRNAWWSYFNNSCLHLERVKPEKLKFFFPYVYSTLNNILKKYKDYHSLIIVGYHLNPYFLVLYVLLKVLADRNVPINVFGESRIIKNIIDYGRYLYGDRLQQIMKEKKVNFINVEEENVGFRVVKLFKKGGVFLFLADFPPPYNKSETTVINFLNDQIRVHVGMVKLSAWFGVPILPLTYNISFLRINIIEHPLLVFNKTNIDTEKSLKESVQRLFSPLEEAVRKHPTQWLLWNVFHKYFEVSLNVKTPPPPADTSQLQYKKIHIPRENLIWCNTLEGMYVLNLSNLTVIKLNKKLFFDLLKGRKTIKQIIRIYSKLDYKLKEAQVVSLVNKLGGEFI